MYKRQAYTAREAFVCGPEPFLAVASEALRKVGVPEERIRIERFEAVIDVGEPDGRVVTVHVELDGHHQSLPWPAEQRLLDVLIAAGVNPPFSCRQGNCGACACRVVSGEVHLLHNEVLEDEDFAEGYTLACQALPVTDEVRISYS